MKPETSRLRARQTFLICLGLVLATVLVYWRVGGFGFLNYDDIFIFFRNPMVRQGLTWKSIVWGATTCFYEYWHPLMWWSHELDCQLFGLNAGAHHLVSLAIHVVNTLLVFAVFRRMTGMVWRSAVVAALFALHPLHVESVAWLAERKDVLSSMFWLLSVWAYVRYAEKSRVQGPESQVEDIRRPSLFYWSSLLFFLLGLLSKPMVVTLPFVLLLLDCWPLNRISDFRLRISDLKAKRTGSLAWLAWEKWPFFILSGVFCLITYYSVQTGNGFSAKHPVSFSLRCSNIPIAYARYLWMAIFPHRLAVLYPMPGHWPWWQVVGATLILFAISGCVLYESRSARYLAFGWMMFLGVLAPTIGLVQTGDQAMADRYMYLPSLGLFTSAVWGVADLATRFHWRAMVPGCCAAVVLTAFAILSYLQVQYWRDSVALWTHCLACGLESVVARQDLALALADSGKFDEAIEQFQAALRLVPDDPVVALGYGETLCRLDKPQEATNFFAKVLRSNTHQDEAHENMGLALLNLGDYAGAAEHFSEAIRLNPDHPAPYSDMGRVLSAQGKSDEAIKSYLTALKVDSGYAAAHYYLGLEYLKRGLFDDAALSLENAEKFDPATLDPRLQLAQIYSRQHETAKAIAEYHASLRLNPNLPEVLNNLAWILATTPDTRLRNGTEAVELAERACEQTAWKQTMLIGTLAAAYAEAGDFDKAVETAQKACDTASAHGEKELLRKNQELMAQYKNHQPVRDTN